MAAGVLGVVLGRIAVVVDKFLTDGVTGIEPGANGHGRISGAFIKRDCGAAARFQALRWNGQIGGDDLSLVLGPELNDVAV